MATKGNARRLLILDDEAAVGEIIAMIAGGMGFDVRTATTSAEFFRQESSWHPTHIALDLVMPTVDGMEVLAEMARRGTTAAIIIVSGAGSRALRAAEQTSVAQGLNVLGAVPKPFRASKLRELLSSERPVRQDPPSPTVPAVEDLQDAIDRQALTVVFQPRIRCTDNHLVGVEVLARWNYPGRGAIGPSAFIPIAEDAGLIVQLTTQVIDMGLEWLARRRPEQHLQMSVNFSTASLTDRGFPEVVENLARTRGIEPHRLILEVSDRAVMADPMVSLNVLARLRDKGFGLSIDDFGSGNASLEQLARMPFSDMKIDSAFVHDASRAGVARKVVRAIVALGHSQDMTVTAEGVEDHEALRFLKDIGCDFAQGYLIGRPMSAERISAWMDARAFAEG
ncbi:EAL domain-containing protein (putative c-di-GMP-specific phosphodiesterase class I) [Stella humosa]|uniref:EAL domain-containing protein (Putative c-di-GMP-specific phosphodiesterase class I) n=1 Tax=Stella humosa TaxID=94 RepID=A0A3N1MBP2_9PROT|nr:EAL domain-containing response regulator [Stella humosa]ROQ01151.1 EAL domain-containing protein (putative c-di-GMP-specific phosphodiesterase class I) [Stella humosa]